MSNRDRNLWLAGRLSWLLSRGISNWPLILIAAFLFSSEGPHLRVSYSYQGSHDYPRYTSCTYLGSRGFVKGYVYRCPIIAWMDAKGFGR